MGYHLKKVHIDAIDPKKPRISADTLRPKKNQISKGENKKINKAVTHFIFKDMMSTNVVMGEGFRSLISTLTNYKIPHRTTFYPFLYSEC